MNAGERGPASHDRVAAAAHDLAGRLEGALAQTRARARRACARPVRVSDQWSPAARLTCGGAGAALLAFCARRRRAAALWGAVLGTGLLVRAAVASPPNPTPPSSA